MRPLSHRFPALRWQPREIAAAPTERTWRSRPHGPARPQGRSRVYQPVRLSRLPVAARTWRVRPLTTEASGRARVYQPYRLARLPVTERTFPASYQPGRGRRRSPARVYRNPLRREAAVAAAERIVAGRYRPLYAAQRRAPARVYTVRPPKGVSRRRGFVRVI